MNASLVAHAHHHCQILLKAGGADSAFQVRDERQPLTGETAVLVGKPRLLLIDEPTEGLAPKIVDEIFHIMEGLRRDGIPIVLVVQNVRDGIDLSMRFYALERGQILLQGDAANPAHRQALFERIAV